MPATGLTHARILALLTAAPSRIAELTEGLQPAQSRTRPNPNAWSVNDVLAHLRSCADVWGDCITRILTEDGPTIRAVNPTTWINRTDYPDLEFQPSFDAFTPQREDLLTIVEALSPEDWSRSATVTGAGKPLERTVRSYAEWLATHERSHVKQIQRIVYTVLRA